MNDITSSVGTMNLDGVNGGVRAVMSATAYMMKEKLPKFIKYWTTSFELFALASMSGTFKCSTLPREYPAILVYSLHAYAPLV
jgi:hypothetical protein